MGRNSCIGFKAAGIASGIKKNGNKDLGIIFSVVPANAAGVFTKNAVQAAPVQLDKERIKSGKSQAIIVNSGNANCCTGDQGLKDARQMAKLAADHLKISEQMVLPASTGVIGEYLQIDNIKRAAPALYKALITAQPDDGFKDFAESIMTTDTVPKTSCAGGEIDGKAFTVTGVAKGAGMIKPDMATMLCFVCTDIEASPEILADCLKPAVDISFNRITIDGDTSTNDTVIIMANGMSKTSIKTDEHKKQFQKILNNLMTDLAIQVVKDGEGVTKLVKVTVKGAINDHDAFKIADTVANSCLVKTAFFGEDANWGRIIGAVGRAGVPIEPDSIDIIFDDVVMVKNGTGCGSRAEKEATKILKNPEFTLFIDMNMGSGSASLYTCDLSLDYVKINADYRS